MFLKFDFSKAYDKVSWRFIFHAMQMIGIRAKLINYIKLFFHNVTAFVNLNGSPDNSFSIERGVRQGCPLAPYLFLIVEETLTHIVKKAITEGRLRGITLPCGNKQQIISQYADDSSVVVRGDKKYVEELVKILMVFSDTSKIEIKWNKSCVYWFDNDKYTYKPEWLAGYNWR